MKNKNTKPKFKYMHTLDGKPAMFNGECIYFAHGTHSAVTLHNSVKEIHRHENLSNRHRADLARQFDYGWVKVRIS